MLARRGVASQFPKLSYIVRAQQVAFVEEPFALSKNATGMLLTLLVVVGAGLCCTAARRFVNRAFETHKIESATDDDFRPRDADDGPEDDEGEESDDQRL